MKSAISIAALAALTACTAALPIAVGLGSAGSIYTAVDKITEAAAPIIAKACDEYEKGKALAADARARALIPARVDRRIASIEQYGDAACAQPPAGDPVSTAIWLGQLIGQISALSSQGKP